MSNLHTVFTDDDGDGIYDDIHVVNVMGMDSSPKPTVLYHRPKRNAVTHSTKSLFSGKTKLKIVIVVSIVFAVFAIVFPLVIGLIGLFV